MAAIGQARPAPATRIRMPLFVTGVALALLAFLVMFAFGLIYAGRVQSPGQTRVVVAAKTIDARTPITSDLLTLSVVPSNAVPPKPFLHTTDLAGYYALVPIYAGEPITANIVSSNPDLLSGGSPSTFLPIPEGFVAITINTSEQEGVGGYIAQGDYIDVLATVNTAQFSNVNPRDVTMVVFTDVYVIRVGPQSVVPRQGQPQGLASSITVVMTLCDAQYMDWLLAKASLKYVLPAYSDYLKAPPKPDKSCPSNIAPPKVGPAQVDARWNFSKG